MLNFSYFIRSLSTVFLLALFLTFVLSGCQTNQPTNTETSQTSVLPDAENTEVDVSAPNINLANPLTISDKPQDVAMCQKMNETIDKSPYANARWGILALSLKDGRVICSRDGRKLFNPASIQKTLTAIVALDKLGADFRWKTSVRAENQIDADGTLNGRVILYGQGAPDFDSTALDNLIAQLQEKGLKKIKGNVAGDESYFRGDTIGDGWTWNELQWYYGAEASALSFNDNEAFINIENGNPRTSTDFIQVKMGNPPNNSTSNSGNSENVESAGVKRGLSDNEFYVWGKAKNFGVRVAVHNPALLAAKSFKEALEKKGITVEGEIESRDWKTEDRTDADNLVELASIESQTLGEVAKKMNKRSINLYAELILRTIGKKFGDSVPGDIQRPQDVRGDDTAGAAVIKKWLSEKNVATEEVQIYDGSGLSRLDFVTPESFVRAFIYAAQSPFADVFADSLPIAATDGTLGGRLGKAKGKIIAKTGSITFVNSLAGYAAGEKETFAFVVIVNNTIAKNGITNVIDNAVLNLVGVENNQEGKLKEEEKSQPDNKANTNQQNSFFNRNM